MPIALSLLSDPSFSSLVDEFFFGTFLSAEALDTSINPSDINPSNMNTPANTKSPAKINTHPHLT